MHVPGHCNGNVADHVDHLVFCGRDLCLCEHLAIAKRHLGGGIAKSHPHDLGICKCERAGNERVRQGTGKKHLAIENAARTGNARHEGPRAQIQIF